MDTTIGIVLVDHGSTRADANDLLLKVAQMYRETTGAAIVEPAHMELAEPTIDQAFAACVAQGATHVIVHPYFLAPGRHSTEDIPRMAAEAASKFPGVSHGVSDPLGLDTRLIEVAASRIEATLAREAVPR
jgi:sirohydrochlorin ferrochelatase